MATFFTTEDEYWVSRMFGMIEDEFGLGHPDTEKFRDYWKSRGINLDSND